MTIDRESIKAKIRKLLNLSKDNAATEGEIDNAMRMAAELMDRHQLQEAEIEASMDPVARQDHVRMGMSDASMVGKNFTSWEFALSGAIENLVGSVKRHYTRVRRKNSFGADIEVKVMRFYGPEEDAQLAADLMETWSQVIATMATGAYGGCFRGDGAQYAMGFAVRLCERAKEAAKSREKMITASTQALVLVGTGSLAMVLRQRQELAAKWLLEEQKIKLGSARNTRGYSGGTDAAYNHGKRDGDKVDFTAQRKPKLGQ